MRGMKKPRLAVDQLNALFLALVLVTAACTQQGSTTAAGTEEQPPPTLETWDEKASYALGLNIGSSLDPGDLDLDQELLLRGFADSLEGAAALDEAEIQDILGELNQKMQARTDRERQEVLLENMARGAAFLAAKANEEGIVKTDSGLLYRIIQDGQEAGDSPTADQRVTVNYRGALIDGTEFDSGESATFSVNGVIDGWSEALQLMKPGARWEIFVPAELGYGTGSRPGIPPGATLVFEVELVDVK